MRRSISLALALGFVAACGNNSSNPKKDAGVADSAPTADAAPDASCFTNPQTHYEIINACTNAQQIYKNSHPPLLGSDGSLPPLP